ncbi:hypothetical protein PUN28_008261 [Cardiocondyla obscurior]|uniref:Uncharacterized protein n=1 Tax=Cardiocondyla obscurior TaxID=286306 RepID=A0AAW2G215_9HYME
MQKSIGYVTNCSVEIFARKTIVMIFDVISLIARSRMHRDGCSNKKDYLLINHDRIVSARISWPRRRSLHPVVSCSRIGCSLESERIRTVPLSPGVDFLYIKKKKGTHLKTQTTKVIQNYQAGRSKSIIFIYDVIPPRLTVAEANELAFFKNDETKDLAKGPNPRRRI